MKKNFALTVMIVCLFSSICSATKVPVWGPPNAPSWWGDKCDFYAYGYWDKTIHVIGPNFPQSPPNDHPRNWASNYLDNTDFKIDSADGSYVTITLKNTENTDYVKEICIYLWGYSDSWFGEKVAPWQSNLDIGGQKFIGNSKGEGTIRGTVPGDKTPCSYAWSYRLEGVIDHQPGRVELTVVLPAWKEIKEIYAGENCIPEPAMVLLLGLGGLALLRRRRG